MAWIIVLLSGFILGWGACMLLDYLFWRNKRICPEVEDEIPSTITRLEEENDSLQVQLAKLTEIAEGKDIEVATLRARIQEPKVEAIATKTDCRAKLNAEDARFDDAYVVNSENNVDSAAKQGHFVVKNLSADTTEPAELTAETRVTEVDLAATGVDSKIEQGTQDTKTANLSSSVTTTNDELAVEAKDDLAKGSKTSLNSHVPDREDDLEHHQVEQNHQACALNLVPSEDEPQRVQPRKTPDKTQVLQSQAPDDLTYIWGIGKNKQKVLNEAGIYKFEQIAAAPLAELDELVAKGGDRFKLANQSTWLEQAQLAASKQWEDLHVLQERLKARLWQETGGFTLRDNLREIWGIGKSKQRALYKAGFHIYKQLASTPVSYFDKFVDERRDYFNLANQKTWPEQARIAVSEQWGALRVLQNKLRAEYQAGLDDLRIIWGIGKKKQKILGKSGIFTFGQLAATPVLDLDELVAKGHYQFNLKNQATWPEQAWLAANEQWEELHTLQNKLMIEVMPELAADSHDHRDNLREIWGIGKRKQRVLNDAGILTFKQLLAIDLSDLDEIVAQSRGNFNLANQSTWPEQAQLAVDQQWGKLRALQRKLKAENRARGDNLRLIRGIGKKKQKSLYKVGIYTFEQLAITPVSDLDVLAAENSSNFNLANQSTWTKQARLAASGDWGALRGYQQVLIQTRRDPSDRMIRSKQDLNLQ